MSPMRRAPLLLALLLAPGLARPEGSAELGDQILLGYDSTTGKYKTEARLDLLAADEQITYTGAGTIDVYDSYERLVATLSSGDTTAPGAAGTYVVWFNQHEDGDWDISVLDGDGVAVDDGGRLYSYKWQLRQGTLTSSSWAEAWSFGGSFYVLVPVGDSDETAVIEWMADGVGAGSWVMQANSTGVDRPYQGQSIYYGDLSDKPDLEYEHPVYLNPPALATWAEVTPGVSAAVARTEALPDCAAVAPDRYDAEITFESATDGLYHLVCDLDGDGIHDQTDPDDLRQHGSAWIGEVNTTWDGVDGDGDAVSPGSYTCRVWVTVGEVHFVTDDVETAYSGMRTFQVLADESRVGTPMFWDDNEANSGTITTMVGGETPALASGADGLDAGDYEDATDPDPDSSGYNARGWGTFKEKSKGNDALLDTWTWVDAAVSDAFPIEVVDPDLDADADGLIDGLEACAAGTDPADGDSDDDGRDDGAEVEDLEDPADSDGDGRIDALDADDDDDGLASADEGLGDADGDGLIDALDLDADDDGQPDADEGLGDSDGDGAPDAQDGDDDDDGLPTRREGADDPDLDGVPSHLDEDADDDGLPDAAEGLGDTDGDGAPDAQDEDDDDDGLLTADEGDGDSDGDGAPDHLDRDSDGDGLDDEVEGGEDTDGDGLPDYLDTDADGDGLGDGDEGDGDLDGDGLPDWLDPTDDRVIPGDTGDTGESGDSGDTGHPGDTGDTGDSGDSDPTGETGDPGHTGDSGDSGDSAHTGDSGDSAHTGDSGDSGHAGDSGDSAHTGDSGDSAHTGDSGDSGDSAHTGRLDSDPADTGPPDETGVPATPSPETGYLAGGCACAGAQSSGGALPAALLGLLALSRRRRSRLDGPR